MKSVSSAIIPLLLGIFTSTAVSTFPKFGKEKGTIEIGQYNHSAINEPLLNPTQSPSVSFPVDSNESPSTSSAILTGNLTPANSEVNQQMSAQEQNPNFNFNANQSSNYSNDDDYEEEYRPHFHHHHHHHRHHNHPEGNSNQNRLHYHHHLDQSVAGIPLVMVPAIPVMQRPIYPVYHEHHHHSHHQNKETTTTPPPERTPPPQEPTSFKPLPTTTITPPEPTTLLPILPLTPFPTTFPPNPTDSTTPFQQTETTTSSPLTTDFSTKIVPPETSTPEPNLTEFTTVSFSLSSTLNSSSFVTNATTLPSTLETTTFLPTTPFTPEPTTVATPPPLVVPGFNLTIDAFQHYNDTINGLETSLPNILNYEAAQIWPLFGINMHSENVSSKLITGNGTAYQNSLENMASQGTMNIGMNNTMKQFSY